MRNGFYRFKSFSVRADRVHNGGLDELEDEVQLALGRLRKKQVAVMPSAVHTFRMIKCPNCGELMTEAFIFKKLPEDMIVSEGARLMSLRNRTFLIW